MSEPRVIHDFATVLALLSGGRVSSKLDGKLAEALGVLAARDEDEKVKASISLTLEFIRVGERVDIKPTIKLKLPDERGFVADTLFAFEDGLSLEHPRQIDMFRGPRDASAARDRAAR